MKDIFSNTAEQKFNRFILIKNTNFLENNFPAKIYVKILKNT